ncbi:hypothetical protein C7M51_02494 [Mixta intestinalis]|uniref:Uncharacterized protein n=1 Tax=Mixta intestinalis TaxID=1615494 RepID=A0A6P1Q277_9GAMM|nr:hypothetical protein C7M51_02494 [Mixta intestinalis]
MTKRKKILIYSLTMSIYILIIPEFIIRTIKSDYILWLSHITSLGGALNPLLSVTIFMICISILLAILTLFIAERFFRTRSASNDE